MDHAALLIKQIDVLAEWHEAVAWLHAGGIVAQHAYRPEHTVLAVLHAQVEPRGLTFARKARLQCGGMCSSSSFKLFKTSYIKHFTTLKIHTLTTLRVVFSL